MEELNHLRIYFDGGLHKKRICFYDEKKDKYFVKQKDGNVTNNDLEYYALIEAIKYAKYEYKEEHHILFIGDSKLVIGQVWGIGKLWKVNVQRLQDHLDEVNRQMSECNFGCLGTWVERDRNKAGVHLDKLRQENKRSARRW